MIQVQVNIEFSADETKLNTVINVLAREDATDNEREVAHAIEQTILALGRAVAEQQGEDATYTETLIGSQHSTAWATDCSTTSFPPWDETRCRVCGWPLAASVAEGCVPWSCSMRPVPARRADEGYAPAEP